jgi:uncharacterized protein (DUF1015 family)
MAIVKPFRGWLPPKEIAEELSCLPYDVMNSEEAARMAEGKLYSLLHITHAEIDCPPGTDIHSETVYLKATDTFRSFRERMVSRGYCFSLLYLCPNYGKPDSVWFGWMCRLFGL